MRWEERELRLGYLFILHAALLSEHHNEQARREMKNVTKILILGNNGVGQQIADDKEKISIFRVILNMY
ncbi:hypothetical protein Tsubulata_014468 [Turnera subulata]|uniref:Uncharacterized protein n=1 Tax=Turnera subulata TaxID=218843 RepID=A0A9Q0JKL3_9ROSI|nr:hypothetical protein Tsubulata_014468 [Turnera subulata]